MQHPLYRPFALPAALAALLLSASAVAQSPSSLERIEVTREKVRADVLRTCPSAKEVLQEGMDTTLTREQIPAHFVVHFDLKDGVVSNVRAQSAPFDYRPALRRAVRQFACQDAAARSETQTFAFVLDISFPDERAVAAGAPRYAMGLRPM